MPVLGRPRPLDRRDAALTASRSHRFHLVSAWRVEAALDEINTILRDAQRLPDWWPSVYLSVDQVEPGDENGLGRLLDIHSRGWLPYTLRWRLRVVDTDHPHGWTIEATGDLEGQGRWTFTPDGRFVDLTYDWSVTAEKPLLRLLAPLLHPVFAANHRWAMARGLEGLMAELVRRRVG